MRFIVCLLLFLFALGTAYAEDDADTLTVEGARYRLDGIDAPELDQLCLNADGEVYFCGRKAYEELQKFVANKVMRCDDKGPDTRKKRRVGQCFVEDVDLQRWLVAKGWAVPFEPYAKGRYKDEEANARGLRAGLWDGCFVAPQDFRYWRKSSAKLLGLACPKDAREKLFPDDARMPAGCSIKGKLAYRAWPFHIGIYHTEGCGSYLRTKRNERWFCSEDEAMEAGFRKSFTCWW